MLMKISYPLTRCVSMIILKVHFIFIGFCLFFNHGKVRVEIIIRRKFVVTLYFQIKIRFQINFRPYNIKKWIMMGCYFLFLGLNLCYNFLG